MINLTNFTNSGQCSNCGECCSDLLFLDEQEIKTIDMYLKNHKLQEHNKNILGKLNCKCPFRNDFLKKCDIYEVRPYICRVFKCDTQPEQAEFTRDEIEKKRRPRSMKELFFKDDSNIVGLKKLGLKLYRRGEK